MKTTTVLIAIRMMIGILYLVSGAQKLLQPTENFVYVIQRYDIIHQVWAQQFIAWFFPWVEYVMGGFLVLGLWTRANLLGIGIFASVFIVAVGQALLRHLPLHECGCFGDLVGVPLWGTFMIDITTLILIGVLMNSLHKTRILSLDNYLSKT